jgi:general stress protein YciG
LLVACAEPLIRPDTPDQGRPLISLGRNAKPERKSKIQAKRAPKAADETHITRNGFASMDREKQLAIARKGGEHALASEAGRKGGRASHPGPKKSRRSSNEASFVKRKRGSGPTACAL